MEQKMEEKFSKMNTNVQDALDSLVLLPFAIITLIIDTPIYEMINISYVRSGRLWVIGSDDDLIQLDTDGNIKDKVDSYGQFCVTENDALLYTSNRFEDDEDDEYGLCIKKKTSQETVTLLKTEKNENVCSIHSSAINGHILVLTCNFGERFWPGPYLFKITRYNKNGVKLQDIKVDDIGTRWVNWRFGFTENRNGDIILSNDKLQAVVGMDSSGGRRFLYSNPDYLTPMDICTDKYGHILVAYDTCIHLLDEDGIFKKILLRDVSRIEFTCLCLDDKQNLYVGTDHGIVKVYKYLKDD